MGQNKSLLKRNHPDSKVEYVENNGLLLQRTFIPPELLLLILSHLDNKTLARSTRVCIAWKEIIYEYVWKLKAERKYKQKLNKYPYIVYQMICVNDPFNHNLVKNPCGKWNIGN